MKELFIIFSCNLLDLFTFNKSSIVHKIKIWFLRILGMRIQSPCFIDYGFRFLNAKNISIGSKCSFGHYNKLWAFSKITIGDKVQTAIGLTIVSGSHDIATYEPTSKEQQVTLEGENWIGANVTIIGGVTIGKGSIIAAGALVTNDIPSYTIAAGVPAKVLNKRIPAQKVLTPFGEYNPSYFENKMDEENI